MDGAESVRSERSLMSSARGEGRQRTASQDDTQSAGGERRSHHRSHRHRSSRSNSSGRRRQHHYHRGGDQEYAGGGSVRDGNSIRDDRSVTIKMPSDSDMRDGEYREERIEAHILAQDQDWGDATTAITDNTSETGLSFGMPDGSFGGGGGNMARYEEGLEQSVGFQCSAHLGTAATVLLALGSFLSPVAMVTLPLLGVFKGQGLSVVAGDPVQCSVACQGLLLSLSLRLVILAAGSWALFVRRRRESLPRVFVLKALAIFVLFLSTFAFWLFYGFLASGSGSSSRNLGNNDGSQSEGEPSSASPQAYMEIVQFASAMADTLVFVHYLAVVLIELAHLSPAYTVTVVRSPDGAARTFPLGQLSIQRAAVAVLEKYQSEFEAYNHHLDAVLSRRLSRAPGAGHGSGAEFKVYEVDGGGGGGRGGEDADSTHNASAASRAIFAASARRRDTSHNNRFHEEAMMKEKEARRRARLITAAEEAFMHVKLMEEGDGGSIATPLDPQEAAVAIFPSMGRALHKYLRTTKQQPLYSNQSVLQRLNLCLAHRVSPRAFLQEFLSQGSVASASARGKPGQTSGDRTPGSKGQGSKGKQAWSLVCESFLSSPVHDGLVFRLDQSPVTLLCTVRKLPVFHLREELVDPKANKFVLKMNSETSV